MPFWAAATRTTFKDTLAGTAASAWEAVVGLTAITRPSRAARSRPARRRGMGRLRTGVDMVGCQSFGPPAKSDLSGWGSKVPRGGTRHCFTPRAQLTAPGVDWVLRPRHSRQVHDPCH